jgi:aminopeptidase N
MRKHRRLIETAADPAEVPGLRMALAGPALTLLRDAEPGSDWQLAWAQLLSWTAVTPEQLDVLAGCWQGSAGFDGLPVGQELRWTVLRRLAVTGRAGDEQIDAELARDTTDAGRHAALGCRADIGDATHKAEAWRVLAESDELGTDGIAPVAAGFRQPEHAALLAPYTEQYFEQLPVIWATRPGMLRIVLGRLLFPYTAGSRRAARTAIGDLAGRDFIDSSDALVHVPRHARQCGENRLLAASGADGS